MTPEAQRIAIATACGWDCSPDFCRKWSGSWAVHPVATGGNYVSFHTNVPNYLSDLNAMNEAEKVLESHPKRDDFGDYLAQIVLGYGPEKSGTITLNLWALRRLIHATAALRAEAFLKTIGKWQPTADASSTERLG